MNPDGPIVILCDLPHGGSGNAAVGLFHGLQQLGLPVEFWHCSNHSVPGKGPAISLNPGHKRPLLERIVRNFSQVAAYRARHRRHTRTLLELVDMRRPRLLHCHNLQSSGLNHDSLLQLPRGLPLVWTLHDAGPVQPRPFEWFDAGLGRIDFLKPKEPNGSAALDRRRRFFAERSDVVLTTPSRWLCAEARRLTNPGITIRHIPYGLDLDEFPPVGKASARSQLGLTSERSWIGFASASAHRRKGGDLLLAAAATLDSARVGILNWGDSEPAVSEQAGVTMKTFGMIHDRAKLRALYAACDVFVCPSRMDNFPLSILESMACGTAVIASDRGGTGEAIERGHTGGMFRGDDSADLAGVLRRFLEKADPLEMGRNARAAIEARYTARHEAETFRELYSELRGSRPDEKSKPR